MAPASGYCEFCRGFKLNIAAHNQQFHHCDICGGDFKDKARHALDGHPQPALNLFLIGHGFMAPQGTPALNLPAGTTVQFYCPEKTKFDSHLEADIFAGRTAGLGLDLGAPGMRFMAGSRNQRNHLLTFPGEMWGTRRLSDLKPLLRMPHAGMRVAAAHLADGDALYVGESKRQVELLPRHGGAARREAPAPQVRTVETQTALLSEIVAAINVATHNAPCVLHWCACRDEPAADAEEFRQDLEKVALSSYKLQVVEADPAPA